MTLRSALLWMAVLAFVALPAAAKNLVTVNGKPIPASRVDALVKQMVASGKKNTQNLRVRAKREIIIREILSQKATRKGLHKRTNVRNKIELVRQSILVDELRRNFTKKNPVTVAEVRAEYKRLVKLHKNDKEYHAKHIMVKKESEAKDIIAKLKGGTSFTSLAKQSIDPSAAKNGGDLGWVLPNRLVKQFSRAMTALKKGQITETPVRTRFGYHVIRLEGVRVVKMPKLDEIKSDLAKSLQNKKLRDFQEGIVKQAKLK